MGSRASMKFSTVPVDENTLPQNIKNYLQKARLVGDIIEIRSTHANCNGQYGIAKYATKGKYIAIPEFIGWVHKDAFSECENLNKLVLSKIMQSVSLRNLPSTLSSLVLPERLEKVYSIDVSNIESLDLELNGNRIRIEEQAIRGEDHITKLNIINSERISHIGYYGIYKLSIPQLTLLPHILTPNSLVYLNIDRLDIWHGQTGNSLRECNINHVVYHIEKKYAKRYTKDIIEDNLKSYFIDGVAYRTMINSFELIIEDDLPSSEEK